MLFYFFVLFSIIPISFILGPSISLANILIIVFSFLIYIFYINEWSWLKDKKIQLLFVLYIYLIFNSFTALDFSNSFYRNFGFIRFIILFAAFNYFFLKFENFNKIFIVWSVILIFITLDVYYESINGINILDLVLLTKLANSKGEIRRMIKNNGLKINNEVVSDETKTIDQNNFDQNNNMKVSHGKKQHVIVKII